MTRTAPSPSASSAGPPPDRRAAGPRHARRLRTHRLARGAGLVTTAILAFSGTAAGLVYADLGPEDTLDPTLVITPTDLREPDPDDPFAGNALNIVLVGTDLRDEENEAIAGESDGLGSDTTMLIHISGDRSWIEVVSIPRDSLVAIPACNLPGGGKSKAYASAQFNSAFALGTGGYDPKTGTPQEQRTAIDYGTACTVTTLQKLTRIQITNTVALKMSGVIGVVDALGGVEMCFDKPVVGDPRYSPGVNFPADRVRLTGSEAIEYLRLRHFADGQDGSDLARIQRQQGFVKSALSQLVTGNLLSDVPRLYGVLGQALTSIVPDPALDSVTELGGLAVSLRHLDTSRIVFTELPTKPAANPNRVVWKDSAEEIWERIARDEPPPGLGADPGSPAGPGAQEGTVTEPDPGSPDATTPATDDGAPGDPDVDPGPGGRSANEAGPAEPAEHLPGVCSPGWRPPSS